MLRWCAVALAGALGGCAVAPPLAVDAAREPSRAVPTGVLAGCRIHLTDVVDARPNGAHAGDIGRRTVVVSDLAERIARQLEAAGVSRAPGTDRAQLRVEIASAYGYGKATSKAFTTVLVAHHDGERIIARGNDTAVNWSSGDGELTRGLLRSADAAIADLAAKLATRCGAS